MSRTSGALTYRIPQGPAQVCSGKPLPLPMVSECLSVYSSLFTTSAGSFFLPIFTVKVCVRTLGRIPKDFAKRHVVVSQNHAKGDERARENIYFRNVCIKPQGCRISCIIQGYCTFMTVKSSNMVKMFLVDALVRIPFV
jgi:hypothetical protein